ncbi:hypothetical protein PR048_004051, partial [Dryococelus australis]
MDRGKTKQVLDNRATESHYQNSYSFWKIRNCPERSDRLWDIGCSHIQNEIISACNNLTVKNIASEVNEAKYFAVLADGKTDIA